MLRAGLIKRLAGGIYTWMPIGLRTLKKVENIVREEMNRAGAIELLMPQSSLPSFGKKPDVGKNTVPSCFVSRIATNATSSSGRPTRR